jgi:hypothetical protein
MVKLVDIEKDESLEFKEYAVSNIELIQFSFFMEYSTFILGLQENQTTISFD